MLKRTTAFLYIGALFWLLSSVYSQPRGKDSCVECHQKMDGELQEPAKKITNDIHYLRGLSCYNCHGGDPSSDDMEVAMDPKKGYIGKPKPTDIPQLCGKCHSNADFMRDYNPSLRVDQLNEYGTSRHGKLLARGDTKVAVCSSCHGAHGIRKASDPQSSVYPKNVVNTCTKCHANPQYMRGHNIPTNQKMKYMDSVHSKALFGKGDLSAPTCNSCHGNHGASPPGLSSIAAICGQCHASQYEYFIASPHKKAFKQGGLPECATCHDNHGIKSPSDSMLGTQTESLCINCHSQGDKGFNAANKMRDRIELLKARLEQSEIVLNRAERAGMEVSREKFDLIEGKNKLIKARVLIHAFNPNEIEKITNEGLAISVSTQKAGERAMGDLQFRRKGLAVSLIIIFLVVITLYMKIRQIERVASRPDEA
ncbi:MAG: cytochrome c3 family protein [Acidobacteria bacterium]|nr:cytochrome c3 family protein [Acidobacteriota bacterium]MBI3655612.1 cytochrome c3 family protein [Acidobacteriota bacterium]